jgi:hypothetical protein
MITNFSRDEETDFSLSSTLEEISRLRLLVFD